MPYFQEDLNEALWIIRTIVHDREVKVLGESIGLVVTLPEGSTTLKDPRVSQVGVFRNRGKHPSEHVVLLDHSYVDLPFVAKFEDLALRNHDESRNANVTLARSLHRLSR